jgi:glycine hydroxymethyltransferase
LLALLVTIVEMKKFGKKYANEILHTTKVFAKMLSQDLDLVGPRDVFTNTHQICIKVDDAVSVTVNLSKVGIITTPMRVPSSDSLGLRLGVQELVRRGIKEKELKLITKVISIAVKENRVPFEYTNDIRKIARSLNKVKFAINEKKRINSVFFLLTRIFKVVKIRFFH